MTPLGPAMLSLLVVICATLAAAARDVPAHLRWKTSFINDGRDEIARYLSQKNTILNASGVVFRKFPGVEEQVNDSMKLSADWLFWIRLLSRGKIAYETTPRNDWRLQSSNARTRALGEIEWTEGSRIITELASLCGAPEVEHAAMLKRYETRCQKWRSSATAT